MSKMAYTVARTGIEEHEFEPHIDGNEIFCPNRDKEIEIDRTIGKQKPECNKKPEDRTGCADKRYPIRIAKKRRNDKMGYSTAQPAQCIINKKFFRPPHMLEFHSEHPEYKHVHQHMRKPSMKEHIRK